MSKEQKQKQAQKTAQKAKSTSAQVNKTQLKAQAEACADAIKEALGKVEDGYFDVCERLYEASKGKYHELLGYNEWDNFVADRFGLKPRKADYFVGIQKAIVACGIKRKDLKGIGWSNMAAIHKVIDPETCKDWLEKAKKSTHRDLTEMVKIARRSQQTPGNPNPTPAPVIGTLTVRMGEDKLTFISNAIASACEMLGTDNQGIALAHIATEWLEAHGINPEALTLDQWVTFLEDKYPAKITYTELEEDEAEVDPDAEEEADEEVEPKEEDDDEDGNEEAGEELEEDEDLTGEADEDESSEEEEPEGDEESEVSEEEDADLDSLLNDDEEESAEPEVEEPEEVPEPEEEYVPEEEEKPKKTGKKGGKKAGKKTGKKK